MSDKLDDLLVVGTGAAGLTAALAAAERGASVLMLTKGHAADSSSRHAQGGIAGVMGDDDTTDLHAIDTERAGRDLCRPSAVRVLVEEGPERVRELAALGVPFDPELSLEGGHSRRRVSSVDGAATGSAVTSRLSHRALESDRIDTREATAVLALLVDGGRCLGVLTPNGPLTARATILAMGGRRRCGPGQRTRPARSAMRWRWGWSPARPSPIWRSCSSTRPCWRAPGCS